METCMQPFATRIDAELLKDFRLCVLKLHGQLYGKMKDEITRGLRNHIHTMQRELEDRRGGQRMEENTS